MYLHLKFKMLVEWHPWRESLLEKNTPRDLNLHSIRLMKLHAFPLLLMLAIPSLDAAEILPEGQNPAAPSAAPNLPDDGFEKVEDLRQFYQQEIKGIMGSCGEIEEITVGNRHYWLCSRYFGSGEVAQEYSIFCERNGRLEASMIIPFQLGLSIERHDSKIVVSTYDQSSNKQIEVSSLDLEFLALK